MYLQSFKDDVELLFERGKLNSSEKMNPAQIRESIKSKYPNRFSIPIARLKSSRKLDSFLVSPKNSVPMVKRRDGIGVEVKIVLLLYTLMVRMP